jgi:hypothetical protein
MVSRFECECLRPVALPARVDPELKRCLLPVWVKCGWLCYDRFNDTQGDPLTVLQNVGAIQRRFNLSSGLGLHWYEWQCGFPDLCTKNGGAHRFKFDTE